MMRRVFLLDTTVLLAAVLAPQRLPQEVCDWLADARNAVWFSAASLWEIAVKASLNRVEFDFRPEDIHALAMASRFDELPVAGEHTYAVATLPWHHRDPFDRLLVAQAMALPATLLTTDLALPVYSPLVMRVAFRG
jgi:PIN domain nuclease of toxin-antitoxin system